MAEPRDLAHQWLTDRLSQVGCADSIGFVFARVDELVDAILDQPGVKVREELWAMGEGTMPEPALSLPNYVEPTHRQIEILLPFQTLGATDAS